MKPYFETKLGKLYHGDCLEILPEFKRIDLCITDPPYGIDYQSAWRTDKTKWKSKIKGDKNFPLWIFDIIKPLIALFVWCRWDILPILPLPKSFIVWDKGCHSMGDLKHEYGRQWEGCAFYPGKQHNFIKRPIDIIRCAKISPEKLTHPNEKPIGTIVPLIKAHKGDIIFDPFFGSGTAGIACEKLGRKWIGIEISEEYCEIAAKRINSLDFGLQQIKKGKRKEGLLY